MSHISSPGAEPVAGLSAADLAVSIAGAVAASLEARLSELHRFVDRRFAELSTEIHASATMAEMSEASLTSQIARVQEEVARMMAAPRADNRTSGLELEAVVQGTENAANEILEAAENIGDLISKVADGVIAQDIVGQVNRIFEACSFQDLTSQRVRRAIQHLEQVDIMLNNIVAVEPQPAHPVQDGNFGGTGADLAQDMIDQMMDF